MIDGDGRAPPRILVVDDTAADLVLIAGMLRPLGGETSTAATGAEALAAARGAPRPDLILLDIMMPELDGYAVLAELRQDPATRDIPVIFVTARHDVDEEARGLRAGAADFIAKPIHAATLLARVRGQLDLARARRLLTGQREWLEQEVARRLAENMKLEARLQLALDASGLGVWEYAHDSGRSQWSPALCAMLGYRAGPASLDDYLDLIHPEDRPQVEAVLAPALRAGQPIHVPEYRMRRGDGSWLWTETRGHVVARDDDGRPRLTMGTIADISVHKAAETERMLSAAVLAGIDNGISITDAGGTILLVNQAFCRATGYDVGELVGQRMQLLHSGRHDAGFYRTMWQQIADTGNWQGEITNRRKDGELVTEWLSVSTVRDASGRTTNYIGIYSDLAGRRAADLRIQYLSSHDPLTELPNRNLLIDRLAQAVLTAQRFRRTVAFIALDIDHFHAVNETLGAHAGDRILVELARRLTLQMRDGDTLGRKSGDEFAFVMAHIAHERDLLPLVARIQEAIAAPFELAGQRVTLSAAIGCSLYPRDGSNAEALARGADIALARARQAGRGTARFFSPQMEAEAKRQAALESGLRTAIARNELSVAYQPQVSLDSGNLLGMEALLRWHSPEFGEVAPAEFIPVAEEAGLIAAIGEWVLRTACSQTRRWLDLGQTALRVSVNLSPRQFHHADLVALVRQALADSGLPPAALELEITEGAVIDDIDNAVAVCRALKELGIKLSLDDFGTGYSSLSYISRFPFDKLKIDQSFIRDIVENPVNAAIATAAIVMARSLNLTVIAEGVETEAQARFLRARHCDAMQGYLYSRPLDADRFGRLLAGDRRLALAADEEAMPTLLLVDDEPQVLISLSRLLRREGYQILTAGNPQQAFDLLARHRVDVVVSDQRMPEMSGTEFFARVRQLYPQTVRLILTGYSDLDTVTDAVNRGAIYKFLGKPWDDDQVREQIRAAFRLVRERAQAEAPHAP
ncbi:EAL domain-containing protein [Azospira restricta]|uniref:EAL domain-containing protein n=1 Tax=Azospira restricta TaxID=404405 RepID=A0A974PXF1_9RHOO|nr:EAL domain-containing protein [Azospira restricta]QRJ63019.1 EAL domain-containing protein [Azospira restricta]